MRYTGGWREPTPTERDDETEPMKQESMIDDERTEETTETEPDDFELPDEPGEPIGEKPLPTPPVDEVAQLRAQAENLREELVKRESDFRELNDKALRALAEADNYKKRLAREGDETRKFAALKMVEAILPAIENLEKGVQAARMENADLENLRIGVEMVYQQIMDALKGEGLERLDVVGKPFDPELCEAVGMIAAADVEEGNVAVELTPGYRFKDRIVRHAKVQIAAPSQPEE
jgi:molecular chaperone GrpE